jgi:hypothetical protein
MGPVPSTYEPGSSVMLSLPEGDVAAVVVSDDGGDTIVVQYTHPRTGRDTGRVPIARAVLSGEAPSGEPG